MQSHTFINRPIARVGIVLMASAALGGAYAFKTVFARPGEDALRLVPSDAFVAASLDLSPSPEQALVFKRIDDSLGKLNKTNILEATLLDAFASGPDGAGKLRPLVTRHGAVAVLRNSADKEVSAAVMIAVSDRDAVQQILKKTGRTEFWKGSMYYRIPNFRMGLMLEGDTLVLSDKPWVMHQIDDVSKHVTKSVLENPDFVTARSKAIPDANAMIFVNPSAFGEEAKQFFDASGSWFNASLAIRDGGLEFKMSSKMNPDTNPSAKIMGTLEPIRKDLYEALPSGAYGVVAISQPGKIYEGIEGMSKKNPDMEKGLTSIDSELQKNLGMSIHEDLVPAFKGDTVVAVYPNESDVTGVNALVVIDDSNGGSPAPVAEKLVKFIDEQFQKSDEAKSKDWHTTINIEGAKAWRISDALQSDMRNGMVPQDAKGVKRSDLVGDKTVAWAHVGNVVIASTSEALLRRAVASYRTHTGGLAGDATFAEGAPALLGGSQSMLAFDFGRIAKGVTNTLVFTDMSPDSAKTVKQILGLFDDLKPAFTMGGKGEVDGSGEMRMFIPLNYEKIIDLLNQSK